MYFVIENRVLEVHIMFLGEKKVEIRIFFVVQNLVSWFLVTDTSSD
jgi:hypothetical protein